MADPIPLPTDGELAILRVLWRRGPSTVRDIHDAIGPETGYTTTLKLMQIMHEKGLVRRDESSRSHVYAARAEQEGTERRLVRDLVDRAFGGSASELVLRALTDERASPEELARIRQVLSELGEDET